MQHRPNRVKRIVLPLRDITRNTIEDRVYGYLISCVLKCVLTRMLFPMMNRVNPMQNIHNAKSVS